VKHYSEEELILHYYGERGRWGTAAGHRRRRHQLEQHVDECPDCAAVYQSVAVTLKMLDAPEAPERGEQYGLEVWQRLRSRLPEPQGRRWMELEPMESVAWTAWLRSDRPAVAGAVVLLAVAAFLAGRLWPNTGAVAPAPSATVSSETADTAAHDGRQRILLTSVAEHLDRSERILTDIMNAPDGGDISVEQRWAADLVDASRLYRQDALDAGEQSVAGVLDDLERNLLEVVHSPSRVTAADLDEVRQRIDAAALLFKARVLGDELRQREMAAPFASPRARPINSKTS
jgi:hypothetical protein